jgi:NAD(P)-dependent dehydrogenase (short-subunit alcohol dehydrogenase family)
MRNLDRRGPLLEAAKARQVSVEVEQLDVTAPGAAGKVRELTLKYGPVYALVNNAGIALGGAFEEQSDAEVREQFETNVFGMMSVTRAVLPSMRAAQRGRVVNVSSVAGRVAFPLLSVYAATKHAVEGFSESLRWEMEPFGVDVCLVEPGTFKTGLSFDFQRRSASGPTSQRASVAPGGGQRTSSIPAALTVGPYAGPYAALTENVERAVREESEKAPPPDAVGKAIAALIADPAPRFRTLVGIDARTLVTLRRMVPDRLFASGIRRLLHLPRSR